LSTTSPKSPKRVLRYTNCDILLVVTRARASRGLTGVILLAAIPLACHRPVRPSERDAPPDRLVVQNPTRAEFMRDTAVGIVHFASARSFDLQQAGMRDTLRRIVDAQRRLWQAEAPREYRFLLRVQCFCPGQRGWVMIDARDGKPLRAWYGSGQAAALTDWSVLGIDALYDNLQRSVERDARVQVAFDARWHFPAYTSTTASARLPDTWSIVEVRAFRPF
jgi:uncharacterized protein DUF6174